MFLFDFLVQRYEIGKLRRRRTVEKFLVINQSYSFQSDRIPPNPPIVKHSLPGLREKSVSKFCGNLDRPDQSGVCPFADLIVRPDDNVGALRHLRSNWETVCNLLGGLDRDFESKIVFEFLCRDRLESLASVRVHPDQKLPIGPGEQVHRDQEQSQQSQQQAYRVSQCRPSGVRSHDRR